MTRFLAMFAAILATSFATAQAQTTVLARNGAWITAQSFDDNHRPECTMFQMLPGHPSRFVAIVYFQNAKSLTIQLGQEDWKLPVGIKKHITYTMTTDVEVPSGGDAIGINAHAPSPALAFTVSSAMVQSWDAQFRKQQNLYFSFDPYGKVTWTFSLIGAKEADDAFGNCALRINRS